MAKTKKRKKNPQILNIIFFVTVLAIIVFLYVKFGVSKETKVVYYGTAEKTFPARGIAVFTEELISSDKNGIAIINYTDGQRVLARTHVATIYSGGIDESKSNLIKQLSEKINYLETSMKNQYNSGKNPQSINTVVYDKMKKISSGAMEGDLSKSLTEATELRSVITNQNGSNLTSQLSNLKTERDDLERSIVGEKEDYISKNAGVIYSLTDGYETTITNDTLKDATTSTFRSLWNSKPVDYKKSSDTFVYGKIINNYEIKVLSLADTKDTEGIQEGATVYIRPESRKSSKIPAIVEKITVNGSKSLVQLRVTRDIESFLTERKFEFEFVKDTYNGLKVPKEAVITENNQSFVYVIKDGIVRKRQLDILYTTGDSHIVKEDNSSDNGLLLYDLIIIKSKNISEGTAVGY